MIVLLLIDVNEWIDSECASESSSFTTFVTGSLVHIYQKEKIALEIAATTAKYKRLFSKVDHHSIQNEKYKLS